MPSLTCATHGRQPETYVCKHIITSLQKGEPCGFWWGLDGGTYEALCTDCNNLSPEAFAKQAKDLIRPLCYGCYRDAAALNGIVLD